MPDFDPDKHRIRPGTRVDLDELPSKVDGGLDKAATKARTRKIQKHLAELQDLLYSEGKHAVLIVLQAMDAAGKDSTVRRCFGPINPQGCRTTSFKAPTELSQGGAGQTQADRGESQLARAAGPRLRTAAAGSGLAPRRRFCLAAENGGNDAQRN